MNFWRDEGPDGITFGRACAAFVAMFLSIMLVLTIESGFSGFLESVILAAGLSFVMLVGLVIWGIVRDRR